MKKFQTPAIQVERFDIEDIVTTSGGPSSGSGTITPDQDFDD